MGMQKAHGARLAVSAGLVAALAGGVSLAPVVALAVDGPAQEEAVDQGVAVESKTVTMVQGSGEAVQYDSIAAAIAETKPYDSKTNKDAYVITLKNDHSEDVSIPKNTKIVIDLNGHTLSNKSGHTITNRSNRFEVKDSVGTGVVDNTSNGKAAFYNDINAIATLHGGSFTRSAEASKSDSDAGGNSYYVLKNYGTMTIKNGVVVKFSDANPGLYSSLVANGWQDAIKAEAGTNGEPKPSDGKKKATLTISGGSFTGGQITVKNDDYGTLTIKGGAINQPSEKRFAVFNNHIATISDGSISSKSSAVASRMIENTGGANNGSLSIGPSAEIVSVSGSPVYLTEGAKATITGGTFDAQGGSVAIDIHDDKSSAVVSGGTYKGSTKVSNRDDVFVDRYSAVEKNGSLVVEMTRPAATVIAEDGSETRYETFTKACSNAPAYSTVKLNENAVLDKYPAEVKAFGVTVDLNGFSIDGSAYTGPKATLTMKTSYGAKPVVGKDSTLRVVNSVPQSGGTIKGKLPVEGGAGDSRIAVPLYIGEEVSLEVIEGGNTAVKLGSSSYLAYSEKAASYVANGGFRMQATDGSDRIYGSPSNAAADLPEGSAITMLHPYVGNEIIYSGSKGYILDLRGNTYSYTGTQKIVDINYGGASIAIRNGMLKAQNPLDTAGVSMLYSNSSLTMDGVTMQLVGVTWGIGTNGTNENNTIRLLNSTIDVTNGLGIYFPSSGSVEITNSVIKAKDFGVQLCAGSLTISGDKTSITASSSPEEKTEGDGPIVDGAAISVVERDGYKDLGKVAISGGKFTSANGVSAIKAYSFNNVDKTEGEWTNASDVVTLRGGTYSAVPSCMEKLIAEGYKLQNNADGSTTVVEENPVVPPSGGGGGSTSDKTDVEHNQDGSTTTTVTKPDGSQTITHETATGTESVVKKDKDGNVTSTEVSVSKQDAESGKVELPIEKSEPAADASKAPEVEVKVPGTVTPDKPVQVTVPVAKAEGAEPNYGIVVYAVDAEGNETVLPKCAVDEDGNVAFEATGNVTIKVVDNAKDMPDVTDADWFAGGVVDFATARGIVNGVDTPSGKQFQGYGKTSRGMLVAMLHNLELNPEAASAGSLPDVPEGAFYADAAAWALGEGILSGVDMPDGTKEFQGDAPVTREQVAVFLMRYAEALGMDTSRRAEIDFPDASEVSGFAKDAMSWAVAEGLFKGDDVTHELNPTDGAARAEVAAVLMRFIKLMYA